jgi:hypothetical protein
VLGGLQLVLVSPKTIRGNFIQEIGARAAQTRHREGFSHRPLQKIPVWAVALTSTLPSRTRALRISREGADFFTYFQGRARRRAGTSGGYRGDRAAVRFVSSIRTPGGGFPLKLTTFFRFSGGRIIEDDTIFDTSGCACEE